VARYSWLAGLLLAASSCARNVAEPNRSSVPDLAAVDGSTRGPPPEDRTRRLTLFPFWEFAIGDAGAAATVSLEGVQVCLSRARRHDGVPADFIDTHGPCATPTTAGEKVVLDGIPAMAELLVTATKEGYRSRAFPFVTSDTDLDETANYPGIDLHFMFLETLDAESRLSPGADPAAGSMHVTLAGVGSPLPFVAGVRLTLDPPSSSKPSYSVGGAIDPRATSSLPGSIRFGTSGDFATVPLSSYGNLAGTEYLLRVSPPSGAHMTCSGDYPGDEVNSTRVPTLAGHSTWVLFRCGCTMDGPQWESSPPCRGGDSGAP
jgi:hypothetical protein